MTDKRQADAGDVASDYFNKKVKESFRLHIFALPAENRYSKVPGVLKHPAFGRDNLAEIIPVEPEQDNACAGKVAVFSSSALHFPTFPPKPFIKVGI